MKQRRQRWKRISLLPRRSLWANSCSKKSSQISPLDWKTSVVTPYSQRRSYRAGYCRGGGSSDSVLKCLKKKQKLAHIEDDLAKRVMGEAIQVADAVKRSRAIADPNRPIGSFLFGCYGRGEDRTFKDLSLCLIMRNLLSVLICQNIWRNTRLKRSGRLPICWTQKVASYETVRHRPYSSLLWRNRKAIQVFNSGSWQWSPYWFKRP